METRFKVEFEITLDRMSASGLELDLIELFPNWKNVKVKKIEDIN